MMLGTSSIWTVDKMDEVAQVSLMNPPVNAIPLAGWDELTDVLHRISIDTAVKSLVLAGAAGRSFCAGADIKESGFTRTERARRVERAVRTLLDVPIPTICVIRGYAIGGGLTLASCCDYRLMERDAYLRMPEVENGALGFGLTLFPKLGVPAAVVRDLHLTGRRVDSAEAFDIHLVNEVADADDLGDTTARAVMRFSAPDRAALVKVKQACDTINGRSELDRQLDWIVRSQD
jgi:enoyl-CoA hydratase